MRQIRATLTKTVTTKYPATLAIPDDLELVERYGSYSIKVDPPKEWAGVSGAAWFISMEIALERGLIKEIAEASAA